MLVVPQSTVTSDVALGRQPADPLRHSSHHLGLRIGMLDQRLSRNGADARRAAPPTSRRRRGDRRRSRPSRPSRPADQRSASTQLPVSVGEQMGMSLRIDRIEEVGHGVDAKRSASTRASSSGNWCCSRWQALSAARRAVRARALVGERHAQNLGSFDGQGSSSVVGGSQLETGTRTAPDVRSLG